MFDIRIFQAMTREERYKEMLTLLKGIIDKKEEEITKLSNGASLIFALCDDISWCGFYIKRGEELILGPFQGLPACTKIALGKGVCGTAAKELKTQVVDNVHEFPGHIACDSASNSEIVIPILKGEELYGVLDIDSTSFNRFGSEDKSYLEKAARIIEERL